MTALLFMDVQVFDGESATLLEGPVLVVGGHVAGVGPSAADQVDGPVETVEGRGRTLLPGLIDAHFHAYAVSLDMAVNEGRPLSYVAHVAAHRLGRALSRGFTTVRDVAGGDAGLAAAIREGLFDSPRYLYTGAALSQTGGHGDPRSPDLDTCLAHGHSVEVVDGVDDLRRAVRERFRTGAHAIKVMTSGGVISPADPLRVPQYSPEELTAVSDEARRRGSYVAAHAYSPEAIEHSVRHGIRSIEHGNLLDGTTAALMAQHGAFLVPTLATYAAMDRHGRDLGMPQVSRDKNAEVLDAGQSAVRIALDAGVPVGFGTDLMGSLETEQLSGLRLQAEAVGAHETLRSATSVNADLIGRPDLGRIVSGAVADLLLVEGDPLHDIEVLASPTAPREVWQAGVRVGAPPTASLSP
ncbi:amidohydrolase family protein [Ornithinimicrobium sp. F0845]|uniref:metal-dependent hydrolase family protein n=1 Tax=Ornithinimicrobium sp. F0845 TaxID=2926412 RepID=UPI001FF35AC9|nr:amidohydrolase family protein [Ornithinimicrobium sp. F0845]MCK0112463.1 amidohydrolase family protein [Ornithinimicrobium sp. F0845]